jgi:hypothetical protein
MPALVALLSEQLSEHKPLHAKQATIARKFRSSIA